MPLSDSRDESVRALRYVQSDENVARLKSLLNDPGWGYLQHPSENHGIGVRDYVVRKTAFGTLKSWGVKVEQPVIREEVRR